MRVLFVQHQPDCPPGLVGDRLVELGGSVDVVDARDPLPDPAGYDLVVPLGSDDSCADDLRAGDSPAGDPGVDGPPAYLPAEWELLADAVRHGVPVFGICFGAQLLCRVLGGTVAPAPGGPEIDWLRLDTGPDGPVGPGPWLTWHLDVMIPPAGSELADSPVGNQAYAVGPHVGVQFHPEATLASIEQWSERYRGSLQRLGRDPVELLARARADQDGARWRASTLVDQVLYRAERMRRWPSGAAGAAE